MLNILALAKDLDRLANETWEKITLGDPWGLKFREDSVTDHNLFDLARKHPRLLVDKHSGRREKRSGADWEWWVGSDPLGWVVLRIQAKRLHGFNFSMLDHDGELDHEKQYETLIRQCLGRPGHYPFHVFYSGWADAAGKPAWPSDACWNVCPAGVRPPDCGHAAVGDFGCSVVASSTVAALASSGNPKRHYAPEHLSSSVPWSYLFRLATAKTAGVSVKDLDELHAPWVQTLISERTGDWLDTFQMSLLQAPGLVDTDAPALYGDPPAGGDSGDEGNAPDEDSPERQASDDRAGLSGELSSDDLTRTSELPGYVAALRRDRNRPDPDRGPNTDDLVPMATHTLLLDLG